MLHCFSPPTQIQQRQASSLGIVKSHSGIWRKLLLRIDTVEAAGANVVSPKKVNYNTSSLQGHIEHHKLMISNSLSASTGGFFLSL